MPERSDADRIHDALANLRTDAEQAWQRRQCLPTALFWKVALGLASYEPGDSGHLQACPHCRRRDEEVHRVARHPGLRGDFLPRPVVALQPLQAIAAKNGAAVHDPLPAPQRLTFGDDPGLTVKVTRDRDAAWLEVAHGNWLPGTLVRIVVAPTEAQARPWSALLLLHTGAGDTSARLRLREPIFKDPRPRSLTVQVVPAASLTPEDAPHLREAHARAAKDDPAAATWSSWSAQALHEGKLPPAIRSAVEEIRRASLPPPAAR